LGPTARRHVDFSVFVLLLVCFYTWYIAI